LSAWRESTVGTVRFGGARRGWVVARGGVARGGARTVELESHAIMDFVVVQRDVILEHRVPLLNAQLLWPRADLSREQLLQVANRIVRVALDADLLPESVVADDLDHCVFRVGVGVLEEGTQAFRGAASLPDQWLASARAALRVL
jgi:hypothetical protein